MVEVNGIEPMASCVQSRRSAIWATPPNYKPEQLMVGLSGLEPETSRLSGVCSNHLSYRPISLITGISKLNSTLNILLP